MWLVTVKRQDEGPKATWGHDGSRIMSMVRVLVFRGRTPVLKNTPMGQQPALGRRHHLEASSLHFLRYITAAASHNKGNDFKRPYEKSPQERPLSMQTTAAAAVN